MPPKKKVVSKSKEAFTASNENLTNVTVRRPIKDNVEEIIPIVQPVSVEEKRNLDVTVVIEKMSESDVPVSLPTVEPIEVESDNVKKIQKKLVKSKPKLKSKQLEEEDSKPKKGRKRAVSEDRTIIYPEQKAIKSRKKASSKDVTDASSDIMSPNKRGRRAASVDILSSAIMVSPPKELKKNRKAEKSSNDQEEEILKNESQEDDQSKPVEKVVKGKKNTKKVVEKLEEKEIIEPNQGIVNDVPKTSQEKPKSKRGVSKKEQTPEDIEEVVPTEKKKVTKTTKSTRGAPKSKQTEENEVEKKTKRAPRGKQVVKSYSEESEDNEQFPEKVEDLVTDKLEVNPEKMIFKTKIKPVKTKEIEKKTKRVPKAKQITKSSEESEDNNDLDTKKNSEIVKELSISPTKINETKSVKEKEIEKKQKRVPRGKQIQKSYEEPDNMNDINSEKIKNDSIDVHIESPEKVEPKPKAKRGVRKEKQNLAEPKLIEELHQKFSDKNLSPTSDEDNTGDLPNGQPSTPESGKNEVQPVVKRKPKGKTAKK